MFSELGSKHVKLGGKMEKAFRKSIILGSIGLALGFITENLLSLWVLQELPPCQYYILIL